ncbi:DUF6959 family protein [Streptomyces sp. NBC_00328]|uniref:DUF6959 family protein n=1 Tax=Streptomyces sp. NBC_00328 TaxID=2903646 RepID=UPI003FA7A279
MLSLFEELPARTRDFVRVAWADGCIEAELFTDGGNDAVVRMSGRRFPGVLVQGDSFTSFAVTWSRWWRHASEAIWRKPGTPPSFFWRAWMLCWRDTRLSWESMGFRDPTELSGHWPWRRIPST